MNFALWSGWDDPGVWKLFWRHLAEINAKNQPKYAQNFKGWLRFLTITSKRSNEFSQFRHCLCFQSRGIHCWHFYWATMFAWSRKFKSTSGSRGTVDSVLWNFEIFTLFMFSRSGNPLLIFLQSYHVWVTSKIQVDFRFKTYSEVLVNVSYRFLKFLNYSCFWGQWIHCWYFYKATMFGWPQKSRYTSGSTRTRRYWWLCLVEFWNFFTIYVFEVRESFADIPTELPCSGDLENAGHLPGSRGFRGYPNIRSSAKML